LNELACPCQQLCTPTRIDPATPEWHAARILSKAQSPHDIERVVEHYRLARLSIHPNSDLSKRWRLARMVSRG